MKPWIPSSLACTFAIAAGVNVAPLRETVKPSGRVSGLSAHETHASASLLGQFRTSISGWLWLRTDLYLHNGVSMRPLTEAERSKGISGVGSSDNTDNALHDDASVVTVIPSAERDFRGFFGDLERATKAYKDMKNHSHNDPRQALPLFRLMTWIDPHFINGWVVGSSVIARDHNESAYRKAIDYLEQGLEKNPENISIQNQMGTVYLTKLRDFRRAVPLFESAISSRKGQAIAQFDPDDQESLEWAYRWLALCYRDTGRLDRMYPLIDEGLALFPEDRVLAKLKYSPPYVLRNRTAEDASVKEQAKEVEDDHDHDH